MYDTTSRKTETARSSAVLTCAASFVVRVLVHVMLVVLVDIRVVNTQFSICSGDESVTVNCVGCYRIYHCNFCPKFVLRLILNHPSSLGDVR